MGLFDSIGRAVGNFLSPPAAKPQPSAAPEPPAHVQPEPGDAMTGLYIIGQYPAALALVDDAAARGIDLGLFQASLLMQVGRRDEARRILWRIAGLEKDPRQAALANAGLGELLLLEQRYDEALDCYTMALKLWPDRASTHRDIAEIWLRRGTNPLEALSWARRAVDKETVSHEIAPHTNPAGLSTALATLAWAVAASSGARAEVEKLAAQALAMAGDLAVTAGAQVHIYCAMAYTALGDPAHRAGHLQAAAAVDPLGAWGREAQRLGATEGPGPSGGAELTIL